MVDEDIKDLCSPRDGIIEKRLSIEKALAIATYIDPSFVKQTVKRTSGNITLDMFIDKQLGEFICEILETGDVAKVSTDKKYTSVWLDVINYMRDTPSTARIVDDLESYLKEFWRALYAQEMLNVATRLAQAALDIDVDGAYEIVRAALDVLPDQDNITYSTATDMARITAERRKSTSPIKSISTYLPSGFDTRVGKLIYGEIFIIGGRPGIGKTCLLLQMAKSMAYQKHSVLYCSTETSRDILWARLLSTETGIPLIRIIDPITLTEAEFKQYDDKNEELSQNMGAYLMLDDRSRTADDIIRQCMRISPDVVIIDHINEMKRPHGKNVVESMWRSDYLKQLRDFSISLKEKGFVIVVASQIKREIHETVDKIPTLAHLRYDDGLAEVADVVMFLHRDDYYSDSPTLDKVPVKGFVRKNKYNKPTIINMIYDLPRQWFLDYDISRWGGSVEEEAE